MTEASRWRLDVAKRMAQIYSENPKVKAMAVGGSVARGIADEYSDLDIIAYCIELPTDEEFKVSERRANGKNWGYYRKFEWSVGVECYIGTSRVEIAHVTIERIENVLADVVDRFQIDPLSQQKAVGGLLDAIPLYGEDIVKNWQTQVSAYPPELAQAMVKKHLDFPPVWMARNYAAARTSALYQYEFICQIEKNILGVLLGLNRIYHPYELKHLDWLIGKMQIAPENLASRLGQVFRIEPQIGVEQLGELIEEIFDLVEEHMPAVETKGAREQFATPDQKCEKLPDGIL